jgi:glycine betaine/proline transport system ATP-binding protein
MAENLVVRNLFKIFGPSPEEALERRRKGVGKDDIYARTRNVIAVDDVSFSVGQGEIFVVMGLSGSGKSTLIRCINRLIEPTSGQVLLDGEDISAADEHRLREIRLSKLSMVFQHFALFPHRTVAENVEFGLKIRGLDRAQRREKAMVALEKVGLAAWADTPPDNLSGGMQQRVGLARGLATDPEVLLMDEPFSALDPLIRRDMQDELIALQNELKMTIIFITHDLHEALKLGDHVAIMKDGRFVQVGVPEEIVGGPADPYVEAFTQDVDRSRVLTMGTIMHKHEALVLDHDAVRTAAFRMRELDRGLLFVRDRERIPVGFVHDHDVGKALKEGVRDLRQIMHTEFPQAFDTTTIAEAYELCVSGDPIAVVDERGRLRGVVNPLDIFAELARGNGGGASDGKEEAAAAAGDVKAAASA